jgi:YD repeat-containing protein
MGAGLKRVAKLCGGLTVKTNGSTVRYDYDADGKAVERKHKASKKTSNPTVDFNKQS